MVHNYMDSDTTEPTNSVGPYWEQPGRRILDNHLVDIPNASEIVPGGFFNEQRVHFTGFSRFFCSANVSNFLS